MAWISVLCLKRSPKDGIMILVLEKVLHFSANTQIWRKEKAKNMRKLKLATIYKEFGQS